MKLFTAILSFLLLNSCAYNIVEEIYFHEDKTCDVKIGLDFSESLDSDNKDIIVSMITEATIGFVDKVTRIDTLSEDQALNDKIVNSLKSSQKDLKPVSFKIAVDTLSFVKKDSIIQGITKKDTLNLYTPEQEQNYGSYIYYITQHLVVKINIDIQNKEMLYGFEFNGLSYDTLDYYLEIFKSYSTDFDLVKSTMWDLGEGIPSWNGNSIDRSNYNFAQSGDDEGKEVDDMTKEAMKNSYYIIKYHFPSSVKKCSNSLYKSENRRKILVFKQSLYDIQTDKINLSTKITY